LGLRKNDSGVTRWKSWLEKPGHAFFHHQNAILDASGFSFLLKQLQHPQLIQPQQWVRQWLIRSPWADCI
jgi:hypothetical protein